MDTARVVWDADWNTWTVHRGYYGNVDITRPAWVVEYAHGRENADRIVRNTQVIDELIGVQHIRLTIKFTENTMTVINYDNDRVIATDVPAVA